MNQTRINKETHEESKAIGPIRCTICGKLIAAVYPDVVPGMIYATCCTGHKISFKKNVPAGTAH